MWADYGNTLRFEFNALLWPTPLTVLEPFGLHLRFPW